jgi:hypothetical protein
MSLYGSMEGEHGNVGPPKEICCFSFLAFETIFPGADEVILDKALTVGMIH